MPGKLLRRLLVGAASIAAMYVLPAASADFYAGKTITVLVNLAAGGPTDIEGRLFARHLAKHIPGKPNVIVKNMEGAGGIVAANYIGAVAKKDGLTIGYFSDILSRLIVEEPGLETDLLKLDYIATAGGTTICYIRTDIGNGVKTAEDLMKVEGFKTGGLSVSSSKDLRFRLAFDMLGLKYQYTTGYKGTANIRRAFQQNEVQYADESLPAYRAVVEPTMVKAGEAIPIWYYPLDDGDTVMASPDAEGIALPFHEFYKKVKGTMPSGMMWDAFRAINQTGSNFLRTIVAPGETPKEALATLRAAAMKTMEDPEFKEDAMKTIKFVPSYLSGEKSEEILKTKFKVTPELKAFIAKYISSAQTGR